MLSLLKVKGTKGIEKSDLIKEERKNEKRKQADSYRLHLKTHNI